MRKVLFAAVALVAVAGAVLAESTFEPNVQVRYLGRPLLQRLEPR